MLFRNYLNFESIVTKLFVLYVYRNKHHNCVILQTTIRRNILKAFQASFLNF